MPEHLHQYRDVLFRAKRTPSIIVQGRRDFIERYIPLAEIKVIFRGYIISRTPDPHQDVLGVWGTRNASHFRRLLRERGACFEINTHDIPPFHPKIIDKSPKKP